MQTYSLSQVNQMTKAEFIAVLGTIFEASPWVAEQAELKRPFETIEILYKTMVAIVKNSNSQQQLALIRTHPDLGSKAKMAESSVKEQAGVGLDRLTSAEYQYFHQLNQTYKDKFGFPFIIAVKNHTKTSILAAFEQRLNHSIEAEKITALEEIYKIAQFRLYEKTVR
ncbi:MULTISPECIES: 2-oxo-4-hydroxy-4-carboxy-5-ureidoimidazoline decarboxylase [Planktothrix]|jgi:2-oxo-4-hydroxy-4-carboxy-5-ureidoimidazoline decarboxylase|uniref:2-oxo-4-hydroxy-4-carboxy-5-ureidoimidazoline decarboxylase n=2 Tax=Planktothrix TaxID=54304 RepID=A0A6J7ZG71_PLARU|nr:MULTISPECIES: 2-oxo-4-hydroxy-4-carboxy-5-ureidoimidazoline decarboxylase [Planktothrix]MCB8752422.1 2-oxo-4-hydroxy-4-carboxy-5-ureidoimidazoline decarboxylase [Planktothrix agardhii 1810]MEA5560660.1 2-oxo-4-hydroxy-4-carboxy-5-ureidoimidazoline decarboxylase [Planktothrix agardhii UHCC 0887]CAC5340049.1 2-oxo-4-hydroxy-4-carboxy-5-ureidoimidazoline decarboxylase [Planktothrix rubescens NIVA-CYA 18]CAD5932264.1 2-oxo-4-hydroxy-4-carboxy-5-ureidoimidazoline decarboxylase [Planktothrix agard